MSFPSPFARAGDGAPAAPAPAALVPVPLFVLFVLGILLLRREQRRLTRKRLGEYAAAGWFTLAEVDMLATPRGRRSALAWARTLRGDRTAVMKGFIADAAALAAVRQRMATRSGRRGRPAGAARTHPRRPAGPVRPVRRAGGVFRTGDAARTGALPATSACSGTIACSRDGGGAQRARCAPCATAPSTVARTSAHTNITW